MHKCILLSVIVFFFYALAILVSETWLFNPTITALLSGPIPLINVQTNNFNTALTSKIAETTYTYTDQLFKLHSAFPIPPAFYGALSYGSANFSRYALFVEEQNADADRVVNQMRYVPPSVRHARATASSYASTTSSNSSSSSSSSNNNNNNNNKYSRNTSNKKLVMVVTRPSRDEGWLKYDSFDCPVTECEFTDDIKRAPVADAIIWIGTNDALYHKRPPNQIWAIWQQESPFATPSYTAFRDSVNFSVTYRTDSTVPMLYGKFLKLANVTRQPQSLNYAAGKTKKVAWFVSNCHASNNRLEYARELAKHIEIDIYGACGNKKCPVLAEPCYQLLSKDYKFYLAFENANCRDYITEKLFDNALKHNVLPVVMGAHPDDYRRAAPDHSFIHVDDFAGPADLAAYLKKLDSDDKLYNEYFEWKGTGEFVNTYWWCRFCTMLHVVESEHRTLYYKDFREWYNKDMCIKGSWRRKQ